MDIKLLLIRAITLMYLEALNTKRGAASSRTFITELLQHVKAPEASVMADFSKDPTTKLRETINWMLEQPVDVAFDRNDLIMRLKYATESEEYLYESAMIGFNNELSSEEQTNIINTNRENILLFINQSKVTAFLKEAYYSAAFKSDQINWSTFTSDIINKLEPFKHTGTVAKATLVESVDLSDPESLAEAFRESLKLINPEGIIRFGWQGFNRMFGSQGGARRGEFIVVGALQSNFKSGTTLEMLKSAALYNKPFMRDPSKKPLLLRISLENPAINDIMHLYRSLIEPELQMVVDENSIDPVKAAIYVKEKLSVNGYHVKIEHHNPSDFTIFDLQALVEDYERKGYEIHMLCIDYLAMMSTRGCKQGATGQDIRDLYRRTRNITEV